MRLYESVIKASSFQDSESCKILFLVERASRLGSPRFSTLGSALIKLGSDVGKHLIFCRHETEKYMYIFFSWIKFSQSLRGGCQCGVLHTNTKRNKWNLDVVNTMQGESLLESFSLAYINISRLWLYSNTVLEFRIRCLAVAHFPSPLLRKTVKHIYFSSSSTFHVLVFVRWRG